VSIFLCLVASSYPPVVPSPPQTTPAAVTHKRGLNKLSHSISLWARLLTLPRVRSLDRRSDPILPADLTGKFTSGRPNRNVRSARRGRIAWLVLRAGMAPRQFRQVRRGPSRGSNRLASRTAYRHAAARPRVTLDRPRLPVESITAETPRRTSSAD